MSGTDQCHAPAQPRRWSGPFQLQSVALIGRADKPKSRLRSTLRYGDSGIFVVPLTGHGAADTVAIGPARRSHVRCWIHNIGNWSVRYRPDQTARATSAKRAADPKPDRRKSTHLGQSRRSCEA